MYIRSIDRLKARIRMAVGVKPLTEGWFGRGRPVHRLYLEQYLRQQASDVRGRCLEFEQDDYTSRIGGANVAKLDIINIEDNHPQSTIVADLTKPNDIPSDSFDCIVCTYVLHIIPDVSAMIHEMHRILKREGTLLVAVPSITVDTPEWGELWRFTPRGLRLLLERPFGEGNTTIQAYGNALTAAGEIRGLAESDFMAAETEYHDPRFALLVCARAVKI